MKKVIEQGVVVPWGYGIAYLSIHQNLTVTYPVPIHWIVRYSRRLWIWIIFYNHTRDDKRMQLYKHDGYKQGVDDGQLKGFRDGYDRGWNDCIDNALKKSGGK